MKVNNMATTFDAILQQNNALRQKNHELQRKAAIVANDANNLIMQQNARMQAQLRNVKNASQNQVKTLPPSVSNAPTNTALSGGSLTTTTTPAFQNLMNAFNKIKGMPYKFGATGNGAIDCSAFTQKMMAAGGVSVPRTAREQFESTKNNLVCRDYEPSKMRPGDMIFFNGTQKGLGPGIASHAAIYIGNGKIIHASSKLGVSVLDLSNGYMRGKWLGVTRPSNGFVQQSPSIAQAINPVVNGVQPSVGANYLLNGGKINLQNVVAGAKKNASMSAKYQQLKGIFDQAQQKTGISSSLLAAIAANESGFNPNATGGPGTTVTGIFQIRPKDWSDGYKWGAKYGVSSTPSPKNNLQATLWVAGRFAKNRDSGYYQKLGISRPTDCDYYMTHFLGEGGYATLCRNLDKPAASVLPKEARYNKSIFYDNGRPRTGRQIKEFMLSKLKKRCAECGIPIPATMHM